MKDYIIIAQLLLFYFGSGSCFLGRGTRIEGDDDVFDLYCSTFDERAARVWHHREITREAVRRILLNPYRTIYGLQAHTSPSPSSTLEEVYRSYYGPQASAKYFLSSLRDFVDEVVSVDSGTMGTDPRYHFSNELIEESNDVLLSRRKRLWTAGLDANYDAVRYLLALSLSSIQDFYSNTNWRELGNQQINEDLGVTGISHNIAPSETPTCKSCFDSTCRKNLLPEVLQQDMLTSGYHNKMASYRNTPEGKCHHGGPKDYSSDGINKELPTSCFSPHSHLHEDAAQLAVKASEQFMKFTSSYLGNNTLSHILSLNPSSSLVFVLQVSQTTKREAEVLKQWLRDRMSSHPSNHDDLPTEYILVPFSYPNAGPIIRSDNPRIVLGKLNKLSFEKPRRNSEILMTALRLALQVSPTQSHVILITDSTLKDSQFLFEVTSLAQSKHATITPILTYKKYSRILDTKLTSNQLMPAGKVSDRMYSFTGDFNRDSDAPIPDEGVYIESSAEVFNVNKMTRIVHEVEFSYVKTFQVLKDLAFKTGSLALTGNKEELVKMLKMTETSGLPLSIITRVARITRRLKVPLHIDSYMTSFAVKISGKLRLLQLINSKGDVIDVLSVSNIENKFAMNIISVEDNMQIRVSLNTSSRGQWHVIIVPEDASSLLVTSQSSLDMDVAFYLPDKTSIHPSLQRVFSNPPKVPGTYLNIMMTGIDTSHLKKITAVQLQNPQDGLVLTTLTLPTQEPRRNTYIPLKASMFTEKSFQVVLTGTDKNGHKFQRISQNIHLLSSALVTLPLGRELWGSRGDQLQVPIKVTNTLGVPLTVTLKASLTNGVPLQLNQKLIQIPSNSSKEVKGLLTLSSDVSSTDTLVVVVNPHDTSDVTYATAHVITTPRQRKDHYVATGSDRNPHFRQKRMSSGSKPKLTLVKEPSCPVKHDDNSCGSYDWEATVEVSSEAPLKTVWTDPSSDQSDLPGNYVQEVMMFYKATCCKPRVVFYAETYKEKIGSLVVEFGDLSGYYDTKLGGATIAWIVVGSILGLLLLIGIGVLLYKRSKKKDSVTYRGRHAVPSS